MMSEFLLSLLWRFILGRVDQLWEDLDVRRIALDASEKVTRLDLNGDGKKGEMCAEEIRAGLKAIGRREGRAVCGALAKLACQRRKRD